MSNEIHDKRDLEKLYELMQLYEKRFTHFAFSYISDSEASKDYVLEAFTDYWNRRHSLGEDPNIPAFILTVVKHKCLNHLRNKKTGTYLQRDAGSTDLGNEFADQFAGLLRPERTVCFRNLPDSR